MLIVIVLYGVVPGMLEYESIPGVSSSKPFGGRSKAHANITVKSITKMVSYFTKERSQLYLTVTLGRSLPLGISLIDIFLLVFQASEPWLLRGEFVFDWCSKGKRMGVINTAEVNFDFHNRRRSCAFISLSQSSRKFRNTREGAVLLILNSRLIFR